MARYKIAFESERNTDIYDGRGRLKSPAGFDVVQEFTAETDDDANQYAEEHYSNEEWYVLDADGDNINA